MEATRVIKMTIRRNGSTDGSGERFSLPLSPILDACPKADGVRGYLFNVRLAEKILVNLSRNSRYFYSLKQPLPTGWKYGDVVLLDVVHFDTGVLNYKAVELV